MPAASALRDRRLKSGSPRAVAALCVLAAAFACGGPSVGEDDLTVRIDAVAPWCGSSAESNQLTITGNMPEKPLVSVVDPSGHPVEVSYRAWMGSSELTEVKWVDRRTVTGVVPPMGAGTYALTLQGPIGGPVVKDAAFRASDSPCPSRTADLVVASAVATPATVVVGEAVTVTASVENRGLAAAKAVSGTITSAPAGLGGPSAGQGAQDVPAGEARTFSWTYTASNVDGGALTIEAGGAAADTNQPVKAAPVSTNEVLINPRSLLSCSSSATPARASVGQVVTVTLVATNHVAGNVEVTPAIEATGPLMPGAQPSAASVPAGGTASFVWTYSTTGPGTSSFRASARGYNATTGEQVTVPTAQATVSVEAPAALATTVTVSPAEVAGSQARTVTLSAVVRNTGGATAAGVTASVGAAPAGTTLSGTAPASQDVPGGASRTFSWIYAIGASPGGTFSVSAGGTDANTRQAVSAPPATSSALVVTYTVGASVSGLSGEGLVLRNGQDSLSVSPSSSPKTVTFPTAVAYGASYAVTVATQPTGQTCTVSGGSGTMGTANVTASVSCSTNSYTLSTSVSPSGGGSVSCDAAACRSRYAHGTSVTLTATPATGYTFSSWSGDCSGSGSCTVTMTANRSVTANFTLNSYALSTSVSPSGAGSVSCDGAACRSSYSHGTSVTLTATPATGYTFSSWSGDCSGSGSCTVTMTADRSVTANFAAITHTVTATTEGAGTGTVTCNGTTCGSYSYGTTVDVVATADSGSTFTEWTGDCTGSGACTLAMTADRVVTAHFSSP